MKKKTVSHNIAAADALGCTSEFLTDFLFILAHIGIISDASNGRKQINCDQQ